MLAYVYLCVWHVVAHSMRCEVQNANHKLDPQLSMHYSGTSPLQTPLGTSCLSFMERCPL